MKRQAQRENEDGVGSDEDELKNEEDREEEEEEDLDLVLDETGRVAGVGHGLDFTTRTCADLALSNAHLLCAEALALDALDRQNDLDSSFWLPAALVPALAAGGAASGSAGQSEIEAEDEHGLCLLEKAALEVFRLHTATCADFDPKRSGAEWWVQVRRPNKPAPTGTVEVESELEGESIQWHFDKDETLQAQFQVICCTQVGFSFKLIVARQGGAQ
jgi:hypothetical protein